MHHVLNIKLPAVFSASYAEEVLYKQTAKPTECKVCLPTNPCQTKFTSLPRFFWHLAKSTFLGLSLYVQTSFC